MATLSDVLRVVHSLEVEDVVESYALGGTVAGLFYGEATCCFRLSICISGGRPFQVFKRWLCRHHLQLREAMVVVHGIPVLFAGQRELLQFEAARSAHTLSYDAASVRVMCAEHLAAFYLADRHSRWGYAPSYFSPEVLESLQMEKTLEDPDLWQKWKKDEPVPVAPQYAAKKRWHEDNARLPIKEKMRQLLELQKHDLPLLAKQRELKWWEKPWDIEP